MKKKITLILAFVLAVFIAGICFFRGNYVLLNGEIVDRDTAEVVLVAGELPDIEKLRRIDGMQILDLRELEITTDVYDMLCEAFPACKIIWNVPFQGMNWDNTISEITVKSMTPEQEEMLKYFPNLQIVDARECGDYDALLDLIAHRTDLQVIYSVDLGDVQLRENTESCTVTNENIYSLLQALPYLPELKTVTSDGCTDYAALMELKAAKPDMKLIYSVEIGGVQQSAETTKMTLDQADAPEALELLQYLPEVKEVEFAGLASNYELMYQLMSQYPDVTFYWEFELFGVQTNSLAKELILNKIPMNSTDDVENALKYFYNLEWVEMCQCGIPSEDMDALWKRHPETRFVWAIPMGAGFVRTDVKAFIPFKYGYNIDTPFYNTQAKELKYLVDLECLDLGHMRMTDISFLQYMPKLRFLILADVVCEDFSYLADLTELVYIELFRSYFDDVELLLNLKKLEDLNIGWTSLKNPEVLKEMTWLKRLWTNMNGMTRAELADLKASMPDTYVYIDSLHPTEGGWRQSDRYYEMRDMLGMFYMK